MMDVKEIILLFFVILHIGSAQAQIADPLAGVVVEKNAEVKLYTTSSDIKYHARIAILDPFGNLTCCLTTEKQLTEEFEIPLLDYGDDPVNVYVIKHDKSDIDFSDKRLFGVALQSGAKIVNSKDNVHTVQYAGASISLTICTSQEGMHVITKNADDGRLLKHLYYYFGYDVRPTCDPVLLQ